MTPQVSPDHSARLQKNPGEKCLLRKLQMEEIIHPVHPRAAVGRTSVDPQAGTCALGPRPPRLRHGPTRPPALQNDRVTLRPTTLLPHTRLPRFVLPPPRGS